MLSLKFFKTYLLKTSFSVPGYDMGVVSGALPQLTDGKFYRLCESSSSRKAVFIELMNTSHP